MAAPEQQVFSAPRGMRDFYPEDMLQRNRLFDVWRSAAEHFGFLPYDACVVESLELLKRKAGEEIVDQIYHFKDKSNRALALRPEMTPTLARMVSSRQGALALPLKWYTIAQCFRYERTTRGRKREHYQWNLDVLGELSISAETELIAAAVHALDQLGLDANALKIHVNNRALLSELLISAGISADKHSAVFLVLDKRGKIPDETVQELLLAGGLNPAEIKAAWDLLNLHSLEDVRAVLPDSPALATLDLFFENCSVYGFSDRLIFDMSVIRGLSYYTGIVFEAFDTQRKFRAVFGGGRYDNLLAEVGGNPLSGVGLGFGDVVINELLDAQRLLQNDNNITCEIAIGYMQTGQQHSAMRLASQLREADHQVDLALSPEKPKKFFSRTGKGNFRKAVYLGPDDIAAGSARIKNLITREEETVPLA